MRLVFLLGLFAVCCQVSAQAVGFHQQVIGVHSARPLPITIWYPGEQMDTVESIGENPVFYGISAIRDAAPKKGRFGVVLLSHGYRGNWRNLSWLAADLVQDGFIVAAVDHPGTTSRDHNPLQASQWWQRPKDLSRVLDWLVTDSQWQPFLDSQRVAAIGHSQGGWTVMNLIGARFDREQFNLDCQSLPSPRTCGLAGELGLDVPQPGEPDSLLKDERIKAAVSLDLGLARGFSASSLEAIATPSLILAAGVDIGDLPQQMESGYLAEHIPENKRQYRVYEDAAHFSFMQLCKPGAAELLDQEQPGDSIICLDGSERSRAALHQDMYEQISLFLNTVFND
ncbi:alpha/beta hydrolase family protein [Gynuella sunshinyii]|uniref:Putative dienelactone hydrolase n=1 Tax=Gynuella sunshinyii YC6258 TaxID=1445510 RepID=A0A0C5UYI9_9GAMM|nr:alpha/beta fold hydrolase [Gynuella sunshinyii]AJQ92355.1 putative dienelactone hydrolase [Gynuella sunshinyii YC6258]